MLRGALLNPRVVGFLLTAIVIGSRAAEPPRILAQPEGMFARNGTDVLLASVAAGDVPLHFQWSMNGTPLSGMTNASLTVTNVQATNSGIYFVTVSNAAGSAISSGAVITVCCQFESISRFTRTSANAAPSARLKWSPAGSLYLVRPVAGAGFVVEKWLAAGDKLWQLTRYEPNARSLAIGVVSFDASENLFLTVGFIGHDVGSTFSLLYKLDSSGMILWQTNVVGTFSSVDPAGNCYVASHSVLEKWDHNANRMWSLNLDDFHFVSAIATISTNGVYVSGSKRAAVPEPLLARYGNDGLRTWLIHAPFAASELHVSVTEDLYLLVVYSDFPFAYYYASKIDPAGGLLWTSDLFMALENRRGYSALDAGGALFLAVGEQTSDRVRIVRWAPSGNISWEHADAIRGDIRLYSNTAIHLSPDGTINVAVTMADNSTAENKLLFLEYRQPSASLQPPTFSADIAGQRVNVGSAVRFEAPAIEGVIPMHFQWLRNGAAISGATNATLVLESVSTNDTAAMALLVTNEFGCALSMDAPLIVVNVLPFRIGELAVERERLAFTVFGEPGRFYWIEQSTNLQNWTASFGFSGPQSANRHSVSIRTNEPAFVRISTSP